MVQTQTVGEYKTKKTIFRTYQLIWYILGLIEVLLGIRIFLRMFAANPNSGFVNLIYSLTYPLAAPFFGIFGVTASERGNVVEWTTFVAMAVYALIAYGIVKLLQLIKPVEPDEVEQVIDEV